MKLNFSLHKHTKRILQSVIGLAVLLSPTCALADPPSGNSWVQTFSDDFNGTKLDTKKWGTCYWWSDNGCTNGGSGDVNWYQNDEISVDNGTLHLRAQKRKMNGYDYTSGMISSHDRYGFQYGYVEMRAKLPKGKGFWSTFWLIPSARNVWPPEIDIVEYLGATPKTDHMTLHYGKDGNSHKSSSSWWTGPDLSLDYHTYGLLWEPDKLVWYVDGVERKVYTDKANIPAMPMQILATFALGAAWTNTPPDATTPFPSNFDIDYIKVWRHNDHPSTPTVTPIISETEALPVAATSGDSQKIETKANFSGGKAVLLNTNADKDYITYTVNVPEARTFNVKVGVKKYKSRGQFQLSVDGKDYGKVMDLYSSSSTYEELDLGNIAFSSPGNKSFKFTVVGKNSSSQGYNLMLDYVKLVPTK